MRLARHSTSTGGSVVALKSLWRLPEVSATHRRTFGYMPPLSGAAKGDSRFNDDPAPDTFCLVETITTTDGKFIVLDIMLGEPHRSTLDKVWVKDRQDMSVTDRRFERAFDKLTLWTPYSVHPRSVRARPDDVPLIYALQENVELIILYRRVADAVRIAAVAGPLPPVQSSDIVWI